jgi:alpha-L-rhamnosidase
LKIKRAIITLYSVLLFLPTILGAQNSRTSISGLKCERLDNPLGIHETRPQLGWILHSDENGQEQSAYQILVATDTTLLSEKKCNMWDSGKVNSDKSININYEGKVLKSRQRCYWKVRICDRDGTPSDWSHIAWWEMGLIEKSDWSARWISSPDLKTVENVAVTKWIDKTVSPEKPNARQRLENLKPAPYMRKSFGVSKK